MVCLNQLYCRFSAHIVYFVYNTSMHLMVHMYVAVLYVLHTHSYRMYVCIYIYITYTLYCMYICIYRWTIV